jgi:hypothetical protein
VLPDVNRDHKHACGGRKMRQVMTDSSPVPTRVTGKDG